jgi:heme exporter protein D
METINHLPFIVGSYAAAFVVVAALIAWVMLDFRAQRRALANLEMRGLTRRSANPHPQMPIQEASEMNQAKGKA